MPKTKRPRSPPTARPRRRGADTQASLPSDFLRHIHDAVLATDTNFRITSWNPAAESMYGWSASEAIGRLASEILGSEITKEERQDALGKLQSAGTHRLEARQRRRDGSPIVVDGTTIVLRDDRGRIRGYLTVNRDISERTRVAEELRRQEARFQALIEHSSDAIALADAEGRVFYASPAAARIIGEDVMGEGPINPFTRLHPDDEPVARVTLAKLLLNPESQQELQVRVRHIDGSWRWLEVTTTNLLADPMVGAIVGNYRDITERKRTETAESQQRALSDALRDTSAALSSTLDYDEVLNRILENVGRVVEYDTADIMLIQDGVARIVRALGFEVFGVTTKEAKQVDFPLRTFRNLREIFEAARPRVIGDTQAWPGWVRVDRIEWVRAYIGAPVRGKDGVIGFLNVSSTRPGFYQEEDGQKLQAFADQAGVALENSRLYGEVRKGREQLEALSHQLLEVQETERRAIARELHDEIGQVLTGVKLTLEMSARTVPESSRRPLQEAAASVDGLMDRVQGLMLDLRPPMLDDLGLLPALLALVDSIASQTNVEVRLEHSGLDRRFAPEVETAGYRIVQEALTNVARHAGVRQAWVRAWADAETLGVRIEDRGAGFNVRLTLDRPARSGLVGMRERTALLGGTFKIESQPGAGTWLQAIVPLSGRIERRETSRDP